MKAVELNVNDMPNNSKIPSNGEVQVKNRAAKTLEQKPIETIKMLYNQLKVKKDFILIVAEDLDKSTGTLQQHWFSRFWSIPKDYQPRVIELLKQTIREQQKIPA